MTNEREELLHLLLGRTATAAVERILAAGYRKTQPITITPCDPEAYARGHNDGYEAAMAQGLADDPTVAEDWLQDQLREARAAALEQAADELAKLPYVRPGHPLRPEYERVLAVRRGNADAWLRQRAASVRHED